MNLHEVIALFVAMALLALVPSTSVALVVARSSTGGFLNGAAVAVGIVLGDLVFVGLAVFGMAALAETMGGLFLILRVMAGLYLIWFGISLLRSKSSMRIPTDLSVSSLSASLLSGLVLTLGDVKAILFYASLFPAFVDLANISAADLAVIIGVTLVAVGGVKLGYAYFAARVVSLLGGGGVYRPVNVTAGGLLAAAGTYLIAKA